jgi:multidrug resistance efflux pump
VIQPGSRAKKGQVVAEFDRQYQLLRLDDYRANLDQQEQSIRSLRAILEVEKKAHEQSIAVAKANLEKARYDLKTIPVQSAIVAEQLRLAEEEAAAQYRELLREVKSKEIAQAAELRASELDRDQSRIELQRAQANADRMVFRAPIDGITVMSSTFRGGEFGQFQAGDEVHPGQMFMRVVDPSSMVVQAVVNQADIELIRIGAPARVRFDAYPDLELPAHIYSIGAMPKSGGFRGAYVKEVPVTLTLERLDPRVIPDLSVGVDVILGTETGATIAPLEGIFFENGRALAFVETGSGWERRELELGLRNNLAAVVRSGLRPGEAIAAERPKQESQ